jgi:hypothetical protein
LVEEFFCDFDKEVSARICAAIKGLFTRAVVLLSCDPNFGRAIKFVKCKSFYWCRMYNQNL